METDPVLLILDNHILHCSLEAVIFCRENNITLFSIPAHRSHNLRPLWLFWALEIGLHTRCDAFIVNHTNEPVLQRNVTGLFKRAYLRVAKLHELENSFRNYGVSSFSPHVFSPEDFCPAQVSSVSNTVEIEASGVTAALWEAEALPKLSAWINDTPSVNIPVCRMSKESPPSYPSTLKVHVSPTIKCPLLQAAVSKKRKTSKEKLNFVRIYPNWIETRRVVSWLPEPWDRNIPSWVPQDGEPRMTADEGQQQFTQTELKPGE
jgi:hypothetical protein